MSDMCAAVSTLPQRVGGIPSSLVKKENATRECRSQTVCHQIKLFPNNRTVLPPTSNYPPTFQLSPQIRLPNFPFLLDPLLFDFPFFARHTQKKQRETTTKTHTHTYQTLEREAFLLLLVSWLPRGFGLPRGSEVLRPAPRSAPREKPSSWSWVRVKTNPIGSLE